MWYVSNTYSYEIIYKSIIKFNKIKVLNKIIHHLLIPAWKYIFMFFCSKISLVVLTVLTCDIYLATQSDYIYILVLYTLYITYEQVYIIYVGPKIIILYRIIIWVQIWVSAKLFSSAGLTIPKLYSIWIFSKKKVVLNLKSIKELTFT